MRASGRAPAEAADAAAAHAAAESAAAAAMSARLAAAAADDRSRAAAGAAASCAAAAPGTAAPGAPVLLRRLRVEFAKGGLSRVTPLPPPAGPGRALRGRRRPGSGTT